MGILLEDRLDTQRLDPSRLSISTGLRLDLLDQLRDPLPVGRQDAGAPRGGATLGSEHHALLDLALLPSLDYLDPRPTTETSRRHGCTRRNRRGLPGARPADGSANAGWDSFPGCPPSQADLRNIPSLRTVPGLEKIPACLIELSRPYLPEVAGVQTWRTGIAMAATAWNLALLPALVRDREIERMFQQAEAQTLDDPLLLEDLLQRLITRKLRLYPDDPRLILSWEVRKAGSRVHITTMATLPDVTEQDPEDSRKELTGS